MYTCLSLSSCTGYTVLALGVCGYVLDTHNAIASLRNVSETVTETAAALWAAELVVEQFSDYTCTSSISNTTLAKFQASASNLPSSTAAECSAYLLEDNALFGSGAGLRSAFSVIPGSVSLADALPEESTCGYTIDLYSTEVSQHAFDCICSSDRRYNCQLHRRNDCSVSSDHRNLVTHPLPVHRWYRQPRAHTWTAATPRARWSSDPTSRSAQDATANRKDSTRNAYSVTMKTVSE
jgi:hypothetical protein